ncbi:zinc-binding dehydrogenase [Pseudarthrobacter sp. NPDC058119]|uniref:zinc-binding dehydrogenase n=1 Tax=Pseudarthrobacter sp. NPDC058119 TaxID=3346348 RepID=UPI0036DA1138
MKGITTVLSAPGEVDQREYDLADPEAGEILLKMIRANVCGSEVHILHGRHPLVTAGCVLGHEGVGRIDRLGSGVTSDFAGHHLEEGDRVVATYFQVCRRCPECNRGQGHLCRNSYSGWATNADVAPHFHGTFGTHYSIGPNQFVYKVPDSVSSKAVSAANCALSQVYAGCETGEIKMGQKVLVLGAGGLGVCASAVSNRMGAEVYVAEMAPGRLAKAMEFGAHHAVDLTQAEDGGGRVELMRETTGGGADVVIDLTGVPDAFSEAVKAVRPGGIMVSIGNISPNKFTQFDPGLFTRSGVQIRAAIRYPATVLGKAVNFIESSPHLPWEDLVDADFAFNDVRDALKAAESREVTRAGLVIDEN